MLNLATVNLFLTGLNISTEPIQTIQWSFMKAYLWRMFSGLRDKTRTQKYEIWDSYYVLILCKKQKKKKKNLNITDNFIESFLKV
jgi:hypothetical protein